MTEEHAQQLDEIRKRLAENPYRLVIGRVSLVVKQRFIDLANTKFGEDYGEALAWLMEAVPNDHVLALQAQIDSLHQRLAQLEHKEVPARSITMANGRTIQVNT